MDLDEMHWRVRHGRHLSPDVASLGILPNRLFAGTNEACPRLRRGAEQGAHRKTEGTANLAQERCCWAGFAALDLTKHGLGHAGALCQSLETPAIRLPRGPDALGNYGCGVVYYNSHRRIL
jgi:hypothetical protein